MTEGEVGSRGAEAAVLGGTDGTGERRVTPGTRANERWRLAGGEALGKKGTPSGGVEAKKTGTGMSAAGDQPRLIQGIRSGDGVGDLFIFIYSSKIQRVIE